MKPSAIDLSLAPEAARIALAGELHDLEPKGAGRVIAAWRGLARRHGLLPGTAVAIQLQAGRITIDGSTTTLDPQLLEPLAALALREAGLADDVQAARATASADFWEDRYQVGDTGWDLGAPAPPLLRASGELAPCRAVVVGCGKGHEVLALARRGFRVVGVDFAPSAVEVGRRAAKEAQLDARFEQADVFALPANLGTFDLWVEHTCFCAIDPARRGDYVAAAARTLAPGGMVLGLFYAHGRKGGPPFSTDGDALTRLFSTDFELLSLELAPDSHPRRRGEELLGRFRRKGDTPR